MSQQPFPSESPSASAGGGGGGGLLPFYHVPQQSRREKLRYPPCSVDVVDPLFMAIAPSSSSTSSHHAIFLHNQAGGGGSSHHPMPNPNPSPANPNPGYASQFDLHPYAPFFPQRPSLVPAPPQPQPLCRGPAEPFTGYAAVLKGSRFLRPAQQLLEEICDVGLTRAALQACSDGLSEGIGEPEPLMPELGSAGDGGERRRTKTRLISMLDEVCRRYKQYFQQIQDVITSFESVAGLSNAAPYTALALNSMTKHFRSLKTAISDQLHSTVKPPGKESHSKDELSGFGFLNGGHCYPGSSARASGTMIQPNVWRPQRGLPERAVAVLKGWLFEHFLHPYPSDADKHMLARQTGLSRNQVSNWFINARVRLWKPLVEEIHALEVRQARKAPEQADNINRASTGQSAADLPTTNPANPNQHHPHHHRQHHHQYSSTSEPSDDGGFGGKIVPTDRSKLLQFHRNELVELGDEMEEPVRFSSSLSDYCSRIGTATTGASVASSGNGGVSLTLGLHQNNGVCLPESLPFNVARRFGLDDTNAPFAYQIQDRHLGKDMDGQTLLRDFGG